ncbi:SMI1/KNR4 family protein [Sphingomonas sp.]|uniref:SMI1/KNR4 family protein n=1 Tax=Sphingomonas sp. TaxID=28214 RepID=UPI00286C51B7|nr:SMI1/KNR4 family protein [Sphingomonas sp.]
MGTDKLDDTLVARLKARAADPDRRTNASGIGSQAVDLGSLLGQIGGQGAALQGFMGQFADVMKGFGVVSPMPVGDRATGRDSTPLPPPATAEQLMAAEVALGFAIPGALRQLYLEIGNGGFGPGDGLYSLDELAGQYKDMTDEPFGPQGQAWPANLLAICHDDPGEICVDRDSGAVIFWDPEEIEGASDKYWQRSFKQDAAGIGELFEKWLGAPTAMERMR